MALAARAEKIQPWNFFQLYQAVEKPFSTACLGKPGMACPQIKRVKRLIWGRLVADMCRDEPS